MNTTPAASHAIVLFTVGRYGFQAVWPRAYVYAHPSAVISDLPCWPAMRAVVVPCYAL